MTVSFYTVTRDTRLDAVAKAIYQTERDGTVEALLDANPGLAGKGPIVARGTVLRVPDRPIAATTFTRPWE